MRMAAELALMLGPIRDWSEIANNLPPMLEAAAKQYGHDRVILAGFKAIGCPASWATSPAEIHQILDELEKRQ